MKTTTVSNVSISDEQEFTYDIQVSNDQDPDRTTHSYTVLLSDDTPIISHNSVSLLAGATPGVHWPMSKFYIRRVRLNKGSELIEPLKRAGYNIEPDVNDKEAVVVEFPIKINENVRSTHEVSIWEKMRLTEFMQKYWADNQVSVTVDFNKVTESKDLNYILQHYQHNLKSVSFLPYDDSEKTPYPQMPYEKITEEQYNEAMKKISTDKLDFSDARTKFEVEFDTLCDTGKCEYNPALNKKRKEQEREKFMKSETLLEGVASDSQKTG